MGRPRKNPPNRHDPCDGRDPCGRDAIWAAIRRAKVFTRPEIKRACGSNHKSVHLYVSGLEAAGYVARVGESATGARVYELVRDVGRQRPRVRADGSTLATAQEAMWLAMKPLGVFTARELAATASSDRAAVSLDAAQKYCGLLFRAGILAAGRSRERRYRVVRWTGPRAPMVCRRRVFDPNTGWREAA